MNYQSCCLCPRMCGIDRTQGEAIGHSHPEETSNQFLYVVKDSCSPQSQPSQLGYCGCTSVLKAARAALHMWEEPCISGVRGSGAIFFSGCTLGCCFCQNHQISRGHAGKELSVRQLADIFLRLQDEGAHNINLVTATQYLPSVLRALDMVRNRLFLPVVYNCGGYERVETIDALKDYIDIYLPDFKYFSQKLSASYSGASNYPEIAKRAITAMAEQAGPPVFEEYSGEKGRCMLMKRGLIIRHMVLPGQKEDSKQILFWIKNNLPQKGYYISLMSQYTPYFQNKEYPELNRRITSYEYNQVVDYAIELGLADGYMQKKSSAKEEYTPPFDLEGL
ncbi:radical SAM protein [Lachnospiraceae bacterium 62-35]